MARRLIAVGRGQGALDTAHLYCGACKLTGHDLPLREVQHLIGVHDRLHHGGAPTAGCVKAGAASGRRR